MTSKISVRPGVDKPEDVKEDLKQSKRDEFLNYLLTTPMSPDLHIPCFRKVMTVRSDDYIPNVMRRLSTEGFSSAPVLSDQGYEGFIDMLDLSKFVTNMFWGTDATAWTDFWDKEIKFQKATVGDVMMNRREQSSRASMTPERLFQDNSTMHALEIMATGNVHRMAILDNRISRKLVGIYTQSMLVSELTQRLYMLGDLRHKPVRDMTGFFSDVVTIKDSAKAINAFNIMSQQDISGLAILDRDGALAGAISITDLKNVGINGQYFSRLFKTIKEYKRLMQENFPVAAPRAHFSGKPIPRQALYVTPDSTFEDVIRLMDDGNIHRVFVCSQESIAKGLPQPIHVITQTDVLSQIWKHYTWAF